MTQPGERLTFASMVEASQTRSIGSPGTPLADALARVGDRWTLLVIAALLEGPRRFGDLERDLPGIAPNILSARLRALEEEGLVLAEPYQQRPTRFVYEVTEPGRELAGALQLLAGWGARQHADEAEPARHSACGSPLEVRLWCPTCEQAVEDREAEELDFA
jgi:DNA-binding HxlR family transcriptional regulator